MATLGIALTLWRGLYLAWIVALNLVVAVIAH
jgi:hypothetical protein